MDKYGLHNGWIQEMESQNKSLYWCTIRLTTEVII